MSPIPQVPAGGGPDVDPVTWARPPRPDDLQLRAEVRLLREQVALLTNQLEALQRANERFYAAEYDRTHGPVLDPGQPFGTEPARKLGTVPFAWRPGGAL
ncbi:hypothetical protein ACWGI0_00205 [Streptomyces sp. NPDC054802]